MSEQPAVTTFRRSFRIGKFTVTLIVQKVAGQPVGINAEWLPYYPGGLSGQLFRKYRRQRDACLSALAEQLGSPILSVDEMGVTTIDPDGSVEMIFTEEGRA